MPPSSRIPPLLQPHTRLPAENSILLLTSTLGASANWLIVRFLCDALTSELNRDTGDGGAKEEVNVILMSWVRDWEFWKQEARKGGGLDLERLREKGRVGFVDGLGGLFLPEIENEPMGEKPDMLRDTTTTRTPIPVPARAPHLLPVRGPPGRIPARGQSIPATMTTHTATTSSNADAKPTSTPGLYTLRSPSLAALQSTIRTALTHLSPTRKTLLILDSPDVLLATTSLSPPSLISAMLSLHTSIPHILVHLSADTALLSQSTPPQPLEAAGHTFLVKMAHMSRRILSCRVLDTGVARDVSGVLRVTANGWGSGGGLELEAGNEGGEDEGNRELLYFVKGDGSVKVFERGAGG